MGLRQNVAQNRNTLTSIGIPFGIAPRNTSEQPDNRENLASHCHLNLISRYRVCLQFDPFFPIKLFIKVQDSCLKSLRQHYTPLKRPSLLCSQSLISLITVQTHTPVVEICHGSYLDLIPTLQYSSMSSPSLCH